MKIAANYIDGVWSAPDNGEFTINANPADAREIVGRVGRSTGADVDRAVRAASRALSSWRERPGVSRGELLLKAALLMEQRADDIAETMTREMGKTVAEAKGETLRAAAIFKYYAAEGARATGDHIPASDGKSLLYTKRIPLGVVGLITPWNFPIAIPAWKMAPALVYGNTVVLKAASNTAVTAGLLVETLEAAGFPPGTVNLVHGSGAEIGGALIGHPLVNGISFTGSNETGKAIAQIAAQRGIKYQLEMGGKNAVIVMADADLDKAADAVVSGAMKSTGQKCTATGIVIVQSSVKAAFTEKLLGRIRSIKVGSGLEPDTYFGPAATKSQQQSVLDHIRRGVEQGAKLLCGGQAPAGKQYEHGYYVEPTLFDGVTTGMSLAGEEIFGPVLSVMEAGDFDEAVRLANSTEYGLSAAIFTSNLNQAMRFIDSVEAGMIKVNAETGGVEYQAPFGGLKKSSSHTREQGQAAIEFFTHVQTVSISG